MRDKDKTKSQLVNELAKLRQWINELEGKEAERKQTEEALKESEENLMNYLESAPDGIYLNDLKRKFLYGNEKAEEIMGYKREELMGKSFLELNILLAI